MLKEKNPLLKLELEKTKPILTKFINFSFEALYELYDFILDSPIENLWYEYIIIILSYLQLIALSFYLFYYMNIFYLCLILIILKTNV